jgi:AmmeMemoRadiSam system protein B
VPSALLKYAAALWLALLAISSASAENAFNGPAHDRALLEAAIEKERPAFHPPPGVTGVTVPHHLLAADLMARGFWAASAGHYSRIIVISPDHFRAVKGKFATSPTDIDTVFGQVKVDGNAVNVLLSRQGLFERIDDFTSEHGLYALMPFIERFFPDAEIVPVAASIFTTPADWDAAVTALAPLVDDETLVVQSTDYSHYLPIHEAVGRDQETLTAISAGDIEAIEMLVQPDHMDSKAAQHIQMSLQLKHIGARAVVAANRSSVEYAPGASSTTSYVVTVYHRDPAALAGLRYADQSVHYFAGDVLLGRYMTPMLSEERSRNAITKAVTDITHGAPLIVNLEGVLVREPVAGVPADSHLMLLDLAAPVLRDIGAVAASLANNHSHDFGEDGFAESQAALKSIGVTPMVHGEVADLGALRLVPLLFLRSLHAGDAYVADLDALDAICAKPAEPPLVVFAHWGKEYSTETGAYEREAAQRLAACGVSLVVGAHSHMASARIENVGGVLQLAWSLGNFIFDQNAERSSGALLELRIFSQGTIATRLIPTPNLFELGRDALGPQD